VLLLGGDQTQAYRLELALETLAELLGSHPGATLLVGGRLVSDPEPALERLGIRDHVSFLGRYTQRDAPEIYRRAHVLLHTKVNDPCPTIVVEAMASGLPVVYAASGGTVELVGEEGGVGVAHPDGFERDQPPDAAALAAAVDRVLRDHGRYSVAARRRAVERFDVRPWLDRHEELFRRLLGGP
jgi:glycosyltransferase involved in cell wall biosynthesis